MDAMKEAKELAESNHRIYGTQLSEALLSAVTGALNERERLREIARDALRFRELNYGPCGHDEPMTKLCTQCEIRAALNEQKGEWP